MLCPFCDEPWPEKPTVKLLALRAVALRHAVPSPRTANPDGWSASSFVSFIEVCNRHRNETTTIPDGLRQGWPSEINFDALPRRLNLLKSQLAAFVKDPASSSFFRATSDLDDPGSLHSSSMEGRLLIFKRSQPG